jgi:transcriptional regulator with PAS, ATPase and Fis domain
MQRAAVLSGERMVIEPEDFSFGAREAATNEPHESDARGTLQEKIEALERSEIERALKEHNNNRTRASEALGLSRQGLLKKLERFGLG